MASRSTSVRTALADALGDSGLAGATSPLRLLARTDPAGEVRLAALRALGRLGEPGVDTLETLLAESRGSPRLVVIEVLLGSAPARAVVHLRRLLADPEPPTRAAALTVWSTYRAEGWAPAAIERLGDPDGGVRRVAEAALVGGTAAEVIPLLIAAYDTEPIDPDRAARIALVMTTRAKRDFGHDPALGAAGRQAVANRMRVWWESSRRE